MYYCFMLETLELLLCGSDESASAEQSRSARLILAQARELERAVRRRPSELGIVVAVTYAFL